MEKTKILERKNSLQLVEEFPYFDNTWQDKKKLAWFDDFIQLLSSLDARSKEESG